jgi:hypothetical protein
MSWKIASLFAAVILVFLNAQTLTGPNFSKPTTASSGNVESQPVVLELFTSEGCSSCPPADALLKQLDEAGHLDDIEIIAIEEHVDYWDRQGWADPFSSHDWTERQERYAQALGRDGVYTPQLIVNGRSGLVGNSQSKVRQNVVEAAKIPRAVLRLSTTHVSPRSAEFSIAIESAPPEARSAELWLAVTERGLSSNVLRGENEGRNLSHAAVLRSLTRVRIKRTGSSADTEANAKIALDRSWKRENLRFVVFLQEPKTLHIFGAAASSSPR